METQFSSDPNAPTPLENINHMIAYGFVPRLSVHSQETIAPVLQGAKAIEKLWPTRPMGSRGSRASNASPQPVSYTKP